MIKKYSYLLLIASVLTPLLANSQNSNSDTIIFSIESCFELALSNDLNTLNIENLEEISQINTRIQQTGLLPNVNINNSYNQYRQNSSIIYNNNVVSNGKVTISDARSSLFSSSMTAGIDVVNFVKNTQAVKAARINAKIQSISNQQLKNNLLTQSATIYTDCIISKLNKEQLEKKVDDSKTFLEMAKANLTSGRIDSTQYLLAFINYENDQIALREMEIEFARLKLNLLQLLGQPLNTNVKFSELSEVIQISSKLNSYDKQNYSIEWSKNQLEFDQLKSLRRVNYFNFFPSISFFGGFSYSDQRLQNGVISQNEAFGPTYGVGFSYSIGQLKNAIHQNNINSLLISNKELELQNSFSRIQIDNKYNNMLKGLGIEKYKSRLMVSKAANSTLQKLKAQFEAGTVSIREVREAQNQLMATHLATALSLKELLINALNCASNKVDLAVFLFD